MVSIYYIQYFLKLYQFLVFHILYCLFENIKILNTRYLVIVYPLKPRLRSKTVLGVIAGIWLFSFCLSCPMIVYAEVETHEEINRTICYITDPFESLEFEFWLILVLVSFPLLLGERICNVFFYF